MLFYDYQKPGGGGNQLLRAIVAIVAIIVLIVIAKVFLGW
jgi:hypothetical protein